MRLWVRGLFIALMVFSFLSKNLAAEKLSKEAFEGSVLPFLEENCATTCHENPTPDFEKAMGMVVPGKPMESQLYRLARGEDSHEGEFDVDELVVLEKWIKGVATAEPQAGHAGKAKSSGPRLMGRVDLTAEMENGQLSKTTFNHQHFLFFLRAKVSPQVSFMGEFVDTSFFEMVYKPFPLVSVHLGKILVPFGENKRFHHFYGAVRGKLFDNILASYGFNMKWSLLGSETLDTYLVQGFGTSPDGNPNLKITNGVNRFAGGLRWTSKVIPKLKLIGSLLYETWQVNKSLYMAGVDFSTDYSLVDIAGLRNIRLGFGGAMAFIQGGAQGDFRRTGDYFQLYTNIIRLGELRLRYGTYINNHLVKTAADEHGFNIAWIVPIDALRLMVEYQWNFEAVNEVKDDLLRIMVSLDF